jgi:FkbM family methyltransferase
MITFTKRVFRKLNSLPVERWRAWRRWDYLRKARTGRVMTFAFPRSLEIKLHPEGVGPERLYTRLEDMTDYALVSQYLKLGMQVIDVGANIGLYSILTDKCVGKDGHIWAFEPSSESHQRLLRNLELNSVTTVTPVKLALADKHGLELILRRDAIARDGDRYLGELTKSNITTPGDSETVSITTLDHYFGLNQSHFDFIKIDVEGAEYAVLRGARRLLTSNPEVVLMLECQAHHCARMGYSQEDVYRFLEELGFGIFTWQSRKQTWETQRDLVKASLNIWASRNEKRLPLLRG